jgi:proline dehydrogenase
MTISFRGLASQGYDERHRLEIDVAPSSLPRAAILRAAESRRLRRIVDRYGMRLGAARFVAGETLDECVVVLRRLNEAGLRVNTTLLGEDVRSTEETAAVVEQYERILDRLAGEELRANVALKLTHLGLAFDEETAYANVQRIVARAGSLGLFVRIDMEQSAFVEPTLRIYERLRDAGHDNVGVVLQAYLYRAPSDLERLLPRTPNIRIVKGAYLEPASIAHPEKKEVDAAYVSLVERALRGGAFVAVATHDERIIRHVLAFARREGIARDRFQLQMLYGVRPALQRQLAAKGYDVLVATPFGPEWYPYLMRRLAERPANTLFFLRNLLRR